MAKNKISDPREEPCRLCKIPYVQSKRTYGHGYDYSEESINCPNCGYPPDMDDEINGIISDGISVNINSSGNISFNSNQLVARVLSEIKKYWPKPRSGKNE